MDNRDWFVKVFRWGITGLIFSFYIAIVFYSFRQNWDFLLTFEYWIDTVSSTAIAIMFRWLFSDSGVDKEIKDNDDIRDKEKGKSNLIVIVNTNDLTEELQKEIDITNDKNKLEAYNTYCDKKINFYRDKSILKPFRKTLLKKWRRQKLFITNEEFNLDAVKVDYYKYDLDEMMSTRYKQGGTNNSKKQSKNQYVVSSLRTNVITAIAFILYNALTFIRKDYSEEALVILIGKLVIFFVNIYTGYDLGKKYINNIYSNSLTNDYAFIKGFLKKHNIVEAK